jgi:hypothetical protein
VKPQRSQWDNVTSLDDWRERKSKSRHPSAERRMREDSFSMGGSKALHRHMVRAHGIDPHDPSDDVALAAKHRVWHQQYPDSYDHTH